MFRSGSARGLGVVVASVVALAACGSPVASGDGGDAAEDAGAVRDAGADAALEAAVDAAGADAAGADGGPDAEPVDAARDAGMDAAVGDAAGDAGGDAAGDAGGDAAGDAGADAGPALVTVGHPREFRGVWVATVTNINFPSRTGLTATQQQAEIVAILNTMARLNLNAVVFQIRAEGDAFYRSTIEPWSRFLSGRQGGDPGYDPLAYLVTEAHRRGIEVHAWLNPYRAKVTSTTAAVSPHITVTNPSEVVTYGTSVWMNPASTVVQDRTARVVDDVVARYDVDGIHFDDYFYPYPSSGDFPDQASYDAYRAAGGTLSRGDWRRDNVNRMVRRVHDNIAAARDDVRFGISPFGIYRPGMPPGITGLDQYNAIYADPVRWMSAGWVDYLAPQLYWPTTQTAQAYGTLLPWWCGTTTGGRYIFTGNYLSQLGSSPAWSVDEFRAQMDLSRRYRDRGSMGNIFFTVAPFMTNRMGVADVFRAEYYQRPALTPPIATMRAATIEPPSVRLDVRTARVSYRAGVRLRAWAVYRAAGAAWTLDRVVPASVAAIDLPVGRYAVSAVSRHGVESRGVVVDVR